VRYCIEYPISLSNW